jgi:predicted nucleic acid-binding Zn ribbon protein
MERQCKECKTEIFGRLDKKFCSDQCRNTYNNRSKKDYNSYISKVNSRLRKNRRILAKLNPDGKTKTTREKLIRSDFDFNYHTNTYTTKEGKTYLYCYDQGYLQLSKEWFALVVKKEYVD